jgi:hypothetical protein
MKILACHPGASFSTADVYSGLTKALKRAGHDVQEYRLDARVEEMHRYLTWQEKRRRRLTGETTPGGIMPQAVRMASMTLLEAALTVNPHWILLFSGQFLHPDTIRLLFRMGANTALLLTESPYDDAKQAKITPYARVVFTNERASVKLMERWWQQTDGKPHWERLGAEKVHYLPHAYDPDVHHQFRVEDYDNAPYEEVPKHDIVFVGSGFIERQEILSAVDWDGLGVDFGLYGVWPYMGSRSKLRKYWRAGTVDNAVTAALYRNARLGLNLYRQSVGTSRNATRLKGAESLNPRALELAATGTPHVSDFRPEVGEVFGDLVPTFTEPHDLEYIISVLVGKERTSYADEKLAQMKRDLPGTVRDWTFDARAQQVGDTLAAELT